MEKVEVTKSCWLWKASKNSYGYGRYKSSGKTGAAHRFCWEFINGPIPAGMSVLHKCDVRDCVNPEHLFLGTHIDNMDDMKRKSRSAQKENHPHSKLTEEQAKFIKMNYKKGTPGGPYQRSEYSLRGLATKYNVDIKTIKRIVSGKTWKTNNSVISIKFLYGQQLDA
jgi:hypothetical protein